MLMKIKCSMVSSIRVCLTFDDDTTKDLLIGLNDIIDMEYNHNGLRKRIIGKVKNISTVGSDPKGWYIIVDGSDDFESDQCRVSPMNILDLEIIIKASDVNTIQTPKGCGGVPYLRVVKGRMQYSNDGVNWQFIKVDDEDVIKDETTVPEQPSDDTILDEEV